MKEILDKIPKKVVSEKRQDFLTVLKMFSPGTSIRSALDDILRARMGALIAVDAPELSKIIELGFKVNCKFSSQKLVELAKMDGAIILSQDLKKILYANALLFPSIGISTKETGTRHKAAERTANQTETIVIAVSERKNKITIYYKNVKYELERSSEVLRRAAETLQILEKQKDILDDILININILEINNFVTISDVCEVLQRMEMIKRISNVVKRYLVELGKEGNILSMRLKELTKNLSKKREMVLMDYFQLRYYHPDNLLKNIDFDMLLEVSNLSKILFEEVHDKSISPKGIRILNKTNLSDKEIKSLINHFKNLSQIFNAEVDSLMGVLKNEDVVSSLVQDLEVLKEKILVGKKF